MRVSRKLTILVAPLVAAVAIGGVAIASNAWHTSTQINGASGVAGTVKPVTATATLGDIYPGQPMKYIVTFTNPNNFPVNILTLQATDVTFTDAAVYPGTDTTLTEHRSYAPLWSQSLDPTLTEAQAELAFDWVGSQAIAHGTHTVTLTATQVADPTWADALKQGSPISLDFWVDEAAF